MELIKSRDSGFYIKTPEINDTWYHYTGINGLLGILDSECLHASESSFLNDEQEVTYTCELVESIFKELLGDKTTKYNYEHEFVEQLIKYNSDFRVFMEKQKLYIISFSKESDSLMLWSNYSSLQGYNIGVNITNLSIQRDFNYTEENMYVLMGEVEFDERIQKEIVLQEINNMYNRYKKVRNESEVEILKTLCTFSVRMAFYSMFFKNPLIKDENECRVVLYLKERNSIKIEHKATRGLIVPYIKLTQANSFKLPISNITIGPSNQFDIIKKGINSLLEANKYPTDEIKIIKSSIQYRY